MEPRARNFSAPEAPSRKRITDPSNDCQAASPPVPFCNDHIQAQLHRGERVAWQVGGSLGLSPAGSTVLGEGKAVLTEVMEELASQASRRLSKRHSMMAMAPPYAGDPIACGDPAGVSWPALPKMNVDR